MIITLTPNQKNTTPKVVEALGKLKDSGGGELYFEKGEYHFFKYGAIERFVAVSNNRSGIKKIIFPIIGSNNITINGNGSVFIFHDITSPFYVYKSKNVTIKDITFDRAFSPIVNMRVEDKSDKGFKLLIDKKQSPYYVKNGNLVFEREWGERSTAIKKLDLLMKGQHLVQYLFAGESLDSTSNLPASFMLTDAEEVKDGVYFHYRENTQSKCVYEEGTELYCLADGSDRESDVILLSDSDDIKISNVTIRRGLSMGVIGQLCSNIEIDSLKTDSDFYKDSTTLTADCMHFVNCSGFIDIHDCIIENISDDVINIHGVYTSLKEKHNNELIVELKHRSQKFFNPYKVGDILDIISPLTYEVVSNFVVKESEIISEDGSLVEICGDYINTKSDIDCGFLIENSKRMPNVNIHNNKFNRFPCMRVSGGGKIVIKNNQISHCACALVAVDLAQFWMESGRIKDLVFTKNNLQDCYEGSFINIGISGMNDSDAFKVHNKIEILENTFSGIKYKAIKAGGIKNLIMKNNLFNTEKEDIVLVDDRIISKELC